jgi:hypothetical protein
MHVSESIMQVFRAFKTDNEIIGVSAMLWLELSMATQIGGGVTDLSYLSLM